jgi:hypothetical protein
VNAVAIASVGASPWDNKDGAFHAGFSRGLCIWKRFFWYLTLHV